MEKEKDNHEQTTDVDKEVGVLKQKPKLAKLENQLTVELAGNGAADIETASLVAKARMKASGNIDVKEIVRLVKEDKPFLFAAAKSLPTRTQPAKGEPADNSSLIMAAKKASKNATRQNVFEYMRARRGWEVEVKR